jgi:hypothetical protein
VHRALDVGAQHGERRLELVGRVGGEAPQGAERRLETGDHRVQRVPQPRQLLAPEVGG